MYRPPQEKRFASRDIGEAGERVLRATTQGRPYRISSTVGAALCGRPYYLENGVPPLRKCQPLPTTIFLVGAIIDRPRYYGQSGTPVPTD